MFQNPLLREIAWILALKLVVLALLWWAFVREARVDAGPQQVERMLLGSHPRTEH